ncbi:M20/M25/M40 family metallo-hydrolase [Ferruginibacter yonginensis]|uniref:Carboxypeptidase Q n=1 Tax=Ferruginibacter yonginensis TaxID=1310416 RepID=A0ABV8QUX7_9BACT
MKSIFFFITILFATVVHAQQNFTQDSIIIKRMVDDVMKSKAAYENLRVLCKKIGPRLSGSLGAEKAITAGLNMLKAAGADTVYLQPCMVPHWVRGAKEVGYVIVGGQKMNLQLTSLGNSEGTKGKLINAPIVEVTNIDELATKNIKGAIVFINIAMNPTYIRTFKAYGESGVGRRSGPSIAAKYGAIAVMVRSLASNEDGHPHTGTTVYNDSFSKIPALAISTNDAERLHKSLLTGKPVIGYLKNNCTMLGMVKSYNVIGELRGSTYPEQIITVGGHLDSWDLAEGAQDDGTGIVQSIEVIRVLKATGMQPKRTVRAVLFMNEENGGGGAKAYLQQAKLLKEQHVFALESDAGGFTPRGFNLDMPSTKKATIQQWAPFFYNYGVYDFKETGSGSDIGPLKEIGTALAGLGTDSQRYFDLHHAETDVFESVSKRELDLGAANMAALIWLVSEYGL